MDRLEAMSILVAAVDTGSLSAAARRLGTPLATVSRKVSDLEAHLRTQLPTRSARRLALTDAGEAYVTACRRILEDVSEAERAASGEYSAPRGDLVISAPVRFGRMHVLPVVTAFLRAYPDVDVRLALTDRVVDLFDERIDVTLRIGPLPDSALMATRLGTIRTVVCGSPDYFQRRGKPVNPADLQGHDCIAFEALSSPTLWTFRAGSREVAVRIRSRLRVTASEAATDAAVAGAGVTRVLSYQIAPEVRQGALEVILVPFEPEPWPVHLIYLGGRLLPLKSRAFLDFAAPRLRERIARDDAH